MKIRPRLAFYLAGTGYNPPRLDPAKVYPAIPADNQPDYKEKGLIFVPFDPSDIEIEGDSIMLEKGDYSIELDPKAMIHLTHTGYYAGQLLCGAARQSNGEYRHAVYAPCEKPEFRATCCPDCLREYAKSYLPEEGERAEEMPQWVTDSLRARYDALRVANVHQGDSTWREWQELSALFA